MNFIIENRLTSLLIIALMGIAISGLVTSLKTNIIEYYLNKFYLLLNFTANFDKITQKSVKNMTALILLMF